jgi:hypothetical protein
MGRLEGEQLSGTRLPAKYGVFGDRCVWGVKCDSICPC